MAEDFLKLTNTNTNVKFWVTPKCGYSVCVDILKEYRNYFNHETDYNFIVVRNPYYRLVSFFIQKMINDPSTRFYNNLFEKQESTNFNEKNGGVDLRNISFSTLIDYIITINDSDIERHLKSQHLIQSPHIYSSVENIKMDRIVKLENLQNDLELVSNDLNFRINEIKKTNHSDREFLIKDGKKIKNKYKTTDIEVKNAHSYTINELKEIGIPKNYDFFLNDEIKNKIYKRYQKDFELFGYEK